MRLTFSRKGTRGCVQMTHFSQFYDHVNCGSPPGKMGCILFVIFISKISKSKRMGMSSSLSLLLASALCWHSLQLSMAWDED